MYNIIRTSEEKANIKMIVNSSFEVSFPFFPPENENGICCDVNNALCEEASANP